MRLFTWMVNKEKVSKKNNHNCVIIIVFPCLKLCLLIKYQKFGRPQACNFIKKETVAQVFSCEFCEISKNTFSTEHLRTTASGIYFSTFHILKGNAIILRILYF